MSNLESGVSGSPFDWKVLVCDVGHQLVEVGARFLKIIGKVTIWRCLPNESKLGFVKWYTILLPGGPICVGTKEPIVLGNLENASA